ncbi:MAG: hypothetical protein HC852_08240 [Acaryochloridaceae cyanobacterium RU_4_10]|nr:hypothetical protein [Acaryochloridaceae cyanobacterium RU_4_10]
MTTLTCTQTGQNISLVQQLAASGEGVIWRTDRPGFLAKIYSLPKPERIQKLEVMIAHPPQDPNAHINHISFAWPTSLLQDASGVPVGFLMPEVSNALELLEVYNPFRRQKVLPEFNWLYLHATAMNVASLVWAIHLAGYVLGISNPKIFWSPMGPYPPSSTPILFKCAILKRANSIAVQWGRKDSLRQNFWVRIWQP